MKNKLQLKNHVLGFIQLIFVFVVLAGAGRAATFTVTNTNDLDGLNQPVAGSLRKAILDANASGDAVRTIQFSIVNASGTVKTITLQAALPVINIGDAFLTIDATTQTGYTNTPVVQLVGAALSSGSGFTIGSGKITIKGFAINRFPGYGILLNCAFQNTYSCSTIPANTTPVAVNLYGNHIGTDWTGQIDYGNVAGGIYITHNLEIASNIGGSLATQRNVISGNGGHGINLSSFQAVYINNNYIGTTANGIAALGNDSDGIYVGTDALNVHIGTTTAQRNVISGNSGNGISDYGGAYIKGNYIGTNAAGTNAIPNQIGIADFTTTSEIGGSAAGEGNVISGNEGIGIKSQQSDNTYGFLPIYGNFIGTTPTGSLAIPNGSHGIQSNAYADIRGNTISGNEGDGIHVGSSGYPDIFNNYIGTSVNGTSIGNQGNGILVEYGVERTKIGDEENAGNNTIAYNVGDGVYLQPAIGGGGGARNVQIRGNSIYSNGGLGIDLGPTNGVTPNDLYDIDEGPNGLQNFPVLSKATPLLISGSLNSDSSGDYVIEFFRVDSCDASGHGEGRYYLGSSAIDGGNGNMSFNLAGYNLAVGQVIVATATQEYYHSNFPNSGYYTYETSEFSQCLTVTPPPGDFAFSSATYTTTESSGTATITVSRLNSSSGTATVNYTTTNGTANAGQDYATASGTLTFSNGQTSRTFTIPITNDTTDEPDETVNIALSNPSPGSNLVAPSTAVLTITDNDNPPTVSVGDVSVAEGNENLTAFNFNVTLSEASGFATSVNWQTNGGTANAGIDYQTNSGTVNFAAGETSKQITVQVYGETLVEINEIFNVNLSAPTLLTIGDGQGVGTILDDDNPGKLSFALAPYNVNESAGVATVTVTRTNGDAGTISIDYATTNSGTATAFSDYTPVANTLIFLDGELQKTFTVQIVEDQIVENTESVGLILSNPTGGASLGLSAAVINITDNDSGNSLAISGHIKKQDNSSLANVQVVLQGTQNLTTTTNANGDYSFTGLTPNGNYTVTPSILGYVFTPINYEHLNLTTSVTNANFTASATPSRMVRVAGGDTVAGQSVSAIVEIVAQGDENSVGFSLSYDAAILSNPQVVLANDSSSASLVVNNTQAAQGRLGVLLSLPAGQVFAAGTKQLVEITFNTAQTQSYSTPLNFNNLPLAREVANLNADPLPTDWTSGTITFAQGYESDVSPRPMGNGNGSVTVADFTQIGRFVAGLNAPDQMNEYQRADTAPRISKGNGVLTVSDYTQAGRYAAGLDPVQFAGGPAQASRALTVKRNSDKNMNAEATNRKIRVVNASAFPGQQVLVAIELDAQGDENSFGFSVNYDPTKLSNPSVSLGADTQGTTLITNTLQTGKVGVLIGLTPGTSIQTGVRQLVVIRFSVLNVPSGQTPITFNDNPIGREVVDSNVNVLETNYADGIVTIMGTTAAAVTVGGQITDVNSYGVSKATVTITNMSGETQMVLTNPFGYYQFTDIEVGETYILTVSAKRYRFNPGTRMLTIMEESNQINFIADN